MVRGTLVRGSGHLYATGPRAADGARRGVRRWLGIEGQLEHVMDREEAGFPSSCGQRRRAPPLGSRSRSPARCLAHARSRCKFRVFFLADPFNGEDVYLSNGETLAALTC